MNASLSAESKLTGSDLDHLRLTPMEIAARAVLLGTSVAGAAGSLVGVNNKGDGPMARVVGAGAALVVPALVQTAMYDAGVYKNADPFGLRKNAGVRTYNKVFKETYDKTYREQMEKL
jgi:hypothetical protein